MAGDLEPDRFYSDESLSKRDRLALSYYNIRTVENELGPPAYRERTSVNAHLRVLVCILTGLVIFGSSPKAIGDSGGPIVYTFGDHLDNNESTYALYFTVPSVIHTGV